MGACSIRICQFPPISHEPQVLEVGDTIASYPGCVGGETHGLGTRLGIPY